LVTVAKKSHLFLIKNKTHKDMNVLRLKKGMILPNQDLLELELSNFINNSSLGKTYTTKEEDVNLFKEKNKDIIRGYSFHRGDGVYLLEDDYEIIVRKVSKNRLEKESIARIRKMLE
tara:strand:+ start:164 stop:514 length:351 start_codon:yes stop_codon:yes gene_type:complete